ncbi:MAG: hypothetical protein JXP34_19200 [Planctomycetes bacterium]|nr:hypothetical protein [Planctomycetota bacterium]
MEICCAIIASVAAIAAPVLAQPSPVSGAEAQAWIRYAVPLPKEIEIPSRIRVAPEGIEIVARPGTGDPLVEQACRELRAAIGFPEGGPSPRAAAFRVILQAGGRDADPLAGKKNADQAYRIIPGEGGDALRLVARTPRGLYYAAKTLAQLIRPRARTGEVEIPLARATDWPDLAERGLWGADTYLNLRWLAERKLNAVAQISYLEVDREGKPHARPKDGHEPLVTEGPRFGIVPVPVVLHLEQVSQKGVFAAYPSLAARGGQEGAICYAQPEFAGILAGWIADLGRLPHVETVDVWMTENLHGQGGCRCDECRKVDRSVQEARTILAAWAKARESVPGVGLSIHTSEETARSNAEVFRALPPEVNVFYYHSLFTYTTGEFPMITGPVANLAASGRWVGVCANLCAWVGQGLPFTGPHFVRYRMREFVEKGLSGFRGYATPRTRMNRFNIEAAAEWSWNAGGRSAREFARSHAVREGLRDPEAFAEWADLNGSVAWDVYGSDWPVGLKRQFPGSVAERLRAGTLPALGTVRNRGAFRGPWGDIATPEILAADVRAASRAVEIARGFERPEFLQESLVVQGLISSLKALHDLAETLPDGEISAASRDAIAKALRAYSKALRQAASALSAWLAIVEPDPAAKDHTHRTLELLRRAVEEMETFAAGRGFAPR